MLAERVERHPSGGEIAEEIQHLLRPRLLVCVAGSYSDGQEHCLELESARQVIRITRTNACVINVPADPARAPKACLSVADLGEAFADPSSVVPLVNTSRATNAAQALGMIEHAMGVFRGPLGDMFNRPPLVKLEILDSALNVRNEEMLDCLYQLPLSIRRRTLPIFSPSAQVISSAADLGCPSVRLLSGRIGHGTGILDPNAVTRAIAAARGLPIILEGGINCAADIILSQGLGAAGVLVNSAFVLALDPVARAREFRQAADEAWG